MSTDPVERLRRARQENRILKQQLAEAVIVNAEHQPTSLADLEAENESLRARIAHFASENERLTTR